MITVTYNDISIECSKALKGSDYVHLLDSSSRIIAAFEKVKDFSAFTISGGKWTTPTVADNCYIAVLGDDGTVQRSNKKASDVAMAANVYTKEQIKSLLAPDVSFLASRDGGALPGSNGNYEYHTYVDSDYFWCWGSIRADVTVSEGNSKFVVPCHVVKETNENNEARYIEFNGTYVSVGIRASTNTMRLYNVTLYLSWTTGDEPTIGLLVSCCDIDASGNITTKFGTNGATALTVTEIKNYYY